jgi:glycosyltransferase involved in cell wall biosynthesis
VRPAKAGFAGIRWAGAAQTHQLAHPSARARGVNDLVKVLLVTMYFPPAGGGGVQRPLKLATHLPALGIETHVLAPDDPKWLHRDEELQPPTQAFVHRARYLGPRARLPAEELHGLTGTDLAIAQAKLAYRRLLLPDASVTWAPTAIPAAVRIVLQEGIDAVLTTSPPLSLNLIGSSVKRLTGIPWVADQRDSVVQNADRRFERAAVRLKEKALEGVVQLVARHADAVVAVSEAIADEVRAFDPAGQVRVIPNGCDFDDFAGLEYRPDGRFRITHTGSFFGKRSPRTFLTALAESGLDDAIARFVGDFRAADREWIDQLGLGDRLELIPYVPRRQALELQRDSEANLLLLPDAAGRGRVVPSGKIFEYLAAERPILAAVPTDGAAASLVRETGAGVVVAPDDEQGLREALVGLHARWRAGKLADGYLSDEQRRKLSRKTRVEELAELLWSLG